MSKISILINCVLLSTILISLTVSEALNDDTNSNLVKWDNILDDCKKELNIDDLTYEKNNEKDDSCFKRCVYDKMNFINENKIDIEKISETYELFKKNGRGNEFGDENAFEIFKKCAKKTNSKSFEDKCGPLKDVYQCCKKELNVARTL